MPGFFIENGNAPGDQKNVIRVDVFTKYTKDMTENERQYVTSLFIRFLLSLALFLADLYFLMVVGDIFCLLVGVIAVFYAVQTGRGYYSVVCGKGIMSTYVFFARSFTFISRGAQTEIPYTAVRTAVSREDGIIIEMMQNNVFYYLPKKALDDCGEAERLGNFLRRTLGGKYKVIAPTQSEESIEKKYRELDLQERIKNLGTLITQVNYTVTADDMRAYHRMLFEEGTPLRRARWILMSVSGACALLMLICSWVFGLPVFDYIFAVFALSFGIFLAVPFIGSKLPAEKDFIAECDEDICCYIHQNGIAVHCKLERVMQRWENMQEVRFGEAGFFADMGKHCTVFIPADLTVGPVLSLVRDAYEAAVPKKEKPKKSAVRKSRGSRNS